MWILRKYISLPSIPCASFNFMRVSILREWPGVGSEHLRIFLVETKACPTSNCVTLLLSVKVSAVDLTGQKIKTKKNTTLQLNPPIQLPPLFSGTPVFFILSHVRMLYPEDWQNQLRRILWKGEQHAFRRRCGLESEATLEGIFKLQWTAACSFLKSILVTVRTVHCALCELIRKALRIVWKHEHPEFRRRCGYNPRRPGRGYSNCTEQQLVDFF